MSYRKTTHTHTASGYEVRPFHLCSFVSSRFCVKVLCLLASIFYLLPSAAKAQRYAVVDLQYIKSQWPEFHKADTTLKLEAYKWEKVVDSARLYADSLAHRFDAEQYMLNDELKAKRRTEVDNANKRVIYLNTHYFGHEGELFKEHERLIQPLQNKLYNTLQQIALKSGWDMVFDKSAGTGMLYSDPKLDKSDLILRELGLAAK